MTTINIILITLMIILFILFFIYKRQTDLALKRLSENQEVLNNNDNILLKELSKISTQVFKTSSSISNCSKTLNYIKSMPGLSASGAKDNVEKLELEISTLKKMNKGLSIALAKLKKTQIKNKTKGE